MVERNSLKDSYFTHRGTSTPDEYASRIQQYAQQLREEQAFRTQIVQHIATDIHLHLTRLKPELANKSFNLSQDSGNFLLYMNMASLLKVPF